MRLLAPLAALLLLAPRASRAQSADAAIIRLFSDGRYLDAVAETRRVIRDVGGTNARLQSFLVQAYAELDSVVAAKRELVIYRRVAPASAQGTSGHRRLMELEQTLDARLPAIERAHAQAVAARRLEEARTIVAAPQRARETRRSALVAEAQAFARREQRLTLSQGTPEQIAALVERSGGGIDRDAANARIEELRFRAADSLRTVAAYETFLRAHPRGRFATTATTRIDDLVFARADATGALGDYLAYRARFPDGRHIVAVNARIDALEEEPVFRAHEREATRPVHRYYALQRYLDRYPTGRFAVEARREMDRILKP